MRELVYHAIGHESYGFMSLGQDKVGMLPSNITFNYF